MDEDSKELERAARAREREERLQRSIQSTLNNLGKRVDKSHKKLDERRSNRPQSRGRHPDKPNKFWAASMQKVKSNGQKVPSKQGIEDDAPRATNFPDLEEFLGKAPDESNQIQQSPRRNSRSPKRSISPRRDSLSRSRSPSSKLDDEDDEEEAEVISLN